MRSTDRKRIYAIGDIHGCLEQLDEMMERIRQDLQARPHPDPLVICMGDYTDRGPDSKGVIDRLIDLRSGPLPLRLIKGNHDERFEAYLRDPLERATSKYHWLSDPIGGVKTLASYGVAAHVDDPAAGHAPALEAVPHAHRTFLDGLELMIRIGSYVFVHAGIRPGVPLDQQSVQDLIWIRDPFLEDPRDHGFTVVFGHTVMPQITNTGGWIGIDTGAVFGGYLSCLVLEDDRQQELGFKRLVDVEIEPIPKRPRRL